MAKIDRRRPTLLVYKVLEFDKLDRPWSWAIKWPRRWSMRSAQSYKTAAAAGRVARRTAREQGIKLRD